MFDKRGLRKYINAPERQAFGKEISNESSASRQAFCLVLFYTGCRISEALNLTPQRIDFTNKTVVFETLKQRTKGNFRAVPIPNSLIALLRQIIEKSELEGRVWRFSRTTAYRLIKKHMKNARVTGSMASPKGLRHGFAVACLVQKIPLSAVKKWLGHARLETTAIYLEVSGGEERELAKRLW